MTLNKLDFLSSLETNSPLISNSELLSKQVAVVSKEYQYRISVSYSLCYNYILLNYTISKQNFTIHKTKHISEDNESYNYRLNCS